MNRIRETRPAPRYGLLWAFVRRMLLLYAAWAVCRVIFYLMNASIIGPVGLNELPPLSEDKTTAEQIELCFSAHASATWEPTFD